MTLSSKLNEAGMGLKTGNQPDTKGIDLIMKNLKKTSGLGLAMDIEKYLDIPNFHRIYYKNMLKFVRETEADYFATLLSGIYNKNPQKYAQIKALDDAGFTEALRKFNRRVVDRIVD